MKMENVLDKAVAGAEFMLLKHIMTARGRVKLNIICINMQHTSIQINCNQRIDSNLT